MYLTWCNSQCRKKSPYKYAELHIIYTYQYDFTNFILHVDTHKTDLVRSTCFQPLWGLSFLPACKVAWDNTGFESDRMYCDCIASSCESEWIIISTSHVAKCYGACSAYNHPLWDRGLAGARSLVFLSVATRFLAPGSWRGPGQKGRVHSPECRGTLCQDQTPSGFGEAGTNSGRCYTCSRGSLAGRAWSPSRSGQWG